MFSIARNQSAAPKVQQLQIPHQTTVEQSTASNQQEQVQSTENPKSVDPLDSLARHIKWEYVIPIALTPAAHICVSLIRKYPQHRRKLIWGVGIATFLTVQTRLILMYDAGYPGAEHVDRDGLPKWIKFLLF